MTLNKLMRLPEKLPCDKRIHIIGGEFLTFITLIGLFIINTNLLIIIYTSTIVLVVVAYGIELYQKYTKSGTYDNNDALAVIIGGLPLIILVVLQHILLS